MKTTINNKEAAILGLLSERPMHGYDLEQAIRMRDMRYWTEISMSSVYKVLKKLEEKNLVTCQIRVAPNNMAQKVYTLTSDGMLTLKEKVSSLYTAFDHHRWEIDLAISNFGVLTGEQKKRMPSGIYPETGRIANGIWGTGEIPEGGRMSGLPPGAGYPAAIPVQG